MNNGRIILNSMEHNIPFHLHDKIENYHNKVQYFIPDRQESSMVSKVFFHPKNMAIIQNNIRAKIHELTHKRYIIDNQNHDNLYLIMKTLYDQHALNLPDKITEQVEVLNNIVLRYSVPKILSEIKSYIKYREDITSLAKPIDRPISTYIDKSLVYNKPLTYKQ